MVINPEPGWYWVRFDWGWEPARFDGEDWLRFGIERQWNDEVREVGERLKRRYLERRGHEGRDVSEAEGSMVGA